MAKGRVESINRNIVECKLTELLFCMVRSGPY